MKLLMVWFGDAGHYWGHLVGLFLVAVGAYLLFDVFRITKAIEGEKQKASLSQSLKTYPGRFAVLAIGIVVMMISEFLRS